MFNSKKVNDSQYLNNATLPTLNDTCNGIPKMTSTPLIPRHVPVSRRSSVLLSPTKSKLVSSRRYSLSDTNSPTSKSNLTIPAAHSPGPLLASLNYKDNVSMYEETKSSGLARRIVLYNEEAEQERPPTHQEKYHSPGLFPIVHLFKKKPPLLEQSPKKVKIKLSSPDYLRNNSPQHRSKLLEGLSRPRLHNQHNLSSCSLNSSEIGTKSVLDALKEISRKRIHSNEGYDLNEDSGKRIRTELHNGTTTTSKRNRADSPQLEATDSPPLKQTQKKFCVYDEFAASMSSSDFSFLNKSDLARSKRKTISTSTESLKETKHVKLINAETQTIANSNETKTKSVATDSGKTDGQKTKKKDSPLKVFDDAPLDRIRKNRLAALMGNLAGKDAILIPKPTAAENFAKEPEEIPEPTETAKEPERPVTPPTSIPEKENKSEIDSAAKPLISILSPSKNAKELLPVKPDKHVHFNIPATTFSVFDPTSQTSSSASVTTPIISPSISSASVTGMGFSVPVSSSADSVGSSTTTPNATLSISFGSPGVSKSDTQISNVVGTSGTSTTGPSFSFPTSLQASKPDTSAGPKLSFEPPKTSSPQKSGGFKFDLKAPTTNVSTAVSKIETPNPNTSNSFLGGGTLSTTSLGSASNTSFSFDKPAEPKKDNTLSYGVTPTATTTATSIPTFTFAGGLSKSQTLTNITSEPKITSLNPPTMTGFSFGPTGNASGFGGFGSSGQSTTVATVGSTIAPTTTTLGFGASPAPSGFGSGSSAFGVPSTTTPSFGNTQNTVATTTSTMFGFGGSTAVTSASGFGSKPTPAFGTINPSAASSSMFGNSGTAVVPAFKNIPTTTTSAFGSNLTTSTPAFGIAPVTSPPAFGSVPVTSASSFGSAPVTTASVFGSNPVTSASVFGNTPVTSMSAFGGAPVTSTPVFGSAVFGNAPVTSTSVFGGANTSATSGFGSGSGATTTSSVFGSGNSTFGSNQTAAPVFGSSDAKAPAFGSSGGFGSAITQAQAPTFGSNTTPSFGNASNVNTFGSNTTPSFGNASNAKPMTAPAAFGSNTFGGTNAGPTTTSAPVFGATNPNSTFNFGSNKPAANVFGPVTTTSASSFTFSPTPSGGTFAPSTGFGSNTPAFGSSTTSATTFGPTSAPPAFPFGGSGENKNTPTFGSGPGNSAFGKPTNTQHSGFGNSTGGFGSSNTGFGTQQMNGSFNFASNTASSAATPFAFGANSGTAADPPKPTFNFTGGSTTQPAFGSNSSAPAFGSTNPSFGVAAPTFGATGTPAAGVFNIGAGSNTGSRPRTQLRAKRRT